MTIDTSGRWWIGSEADDIQRYLKSYEAGGYAVHETRLCKCPCGSVQFELEADRCEGCAQRTCALCGVSHFICDSEGYWREAAPERWSCTECGCKTCNLGVAFSLYPPESRPAEFRSKPDVRWLSIGSRCTGCGILSSFVDWKVGYGESHRLIEQV